MGVYIYGATNAELLDILNNGIHESKEYRWVEVPEPHGDLIDRSKAIMELRLSYPMTPMFKELREEWRIKNEGYVSADNIVMHAPTVIEAEGE